MEKPNGRAKWQDRMAGLDGRAGYAFLDVGPVNMCWILGGQRSTQQRRASPRMATVGNGSKWA